MPLFEITSHIRMGYDLEAALSTALSHLCDALVPGAGADVQFTSTSLHGGTVVASYFSRGAQQERNAVIIKVYHGNEGPQYVEALRQGIVRLWGDTVTGDAASKGWLGRLATRERYLKTVWFVPGVAQWEG